MNDLQTRINSITQCISSSSSKLNKVILSLQAFSGLDITHFSEQKKKAIYKHLSIVNNIMALYPMIKTHDDYKVISDLNLDKILKSIQQVCLKLLID